MGCAVCSQEYGLSHNCPGVAPAQMTQEESAPPPSGFAPLYYLGLAFNIARWDDVSIRRASRDSQATIYGIGLWMISALIILAVSAIPQILRAGQLSGPALGIGIVFGLAFGLAVMAIITYMQMGLCYLIAKLFFGGTGTFMGVIRPLLLGWIVNVLVLVPVAGTWLSAIAWTAVLMLVFEEADGITRLQAFGISAGINAVFFILQVMIMPHH